MTGKIIDRETTGFLVLIIPIAIAIIVLFTAWKWILLFIVLSVLLTVWRSYQWIKWSEKISPIFNQLIKENQGCLTPMDLSLKANLSGRSAKRFLEKKAEEFGAQRQETEDKGTVYYFLTASTLGKIFDDSEPSLESSTTTLAAATPSPGSFLGQLLGIDEPDESLVEEKLTDVPEETSVASVEETPQDFVTETVPTTVTPESPKSLENLALIQSELAKRLDINPSTIGRKKSSSDFAQWTRSRDPDGIAWKYVSKTQMFVPVDT